MAELATMIVERHGDLQVVRLAGEIDISNATKLTEEISNAVPNDAAGLVIDLSDTGYLDSAGIGMLFNLAQRLGGRRQAVAAVVPEDALIRHALVLTEVHQVVPLHPTLEEAVGALKDHG